MTVLVTLFFAFIYFVFLSFSVHKKNISKELLIAVSIGITFGILLSISFVWIIVGVTNYNTPISPASSFLYSPIVEEISKILAIFSGVFICRKKWLVTNLELLRAAGGIGLGFGIFETFDYILQTAGFQATIERLLISVPFHMSSAILIAFGFIFLKTKGALLMLVLAISFHTLSNFLAIFNPLLQGIIFWILLIVLYLSDEMIIPLLQRMKLYSEKEKSDS
jgi:hypothetical protein